MELALDRAFFNTKIPYKGANTLRQVQEEHKPFKMVVEIDGKDKTFVTPKKINGTLWREAATVSQDIENNDLLIADLDSHLQFVCNIFGNQFSIDELENGVDSRDLIKIIYASALFVMGQVTIASEMLSHNVDVAEIDKKKQ